MTKIVLDKQGLWKALQYENKQKQQTTFSHHQDAFVKFQNAKVWVCAQTTVSNQIGSQAYYFSS